MKPSVVRRVARVLCAMYYEQVLSRTHCGRGIRVKEFSNLTQTEKELFLRAAECCLQLQAVPSEYLEAQFQAFERFSRAIKRTVFPQPNQLASAGAHVKYALYVAQKEQRRRQDASKRESQKDKFFRETRKLGALSKRLRQPQEDILVNHPNEFTKAFLEHRKVWHLVQTTYDG